MVVLGLASVTRAQTFLADDHTRFAAELAPPPANDSLAGLADLDVVLQIQHERSEEQTVRAQRVVKHSPFLMGSSVLGAWFDPANLPRTAELFQKVWSQTNQVTGAIKKQWNRPRPHARDERVQPCVPVPRDFSYPSGHSTNATVWAAVFSEIFPEHAAAFDAQARETRWARILGGAHFPTDVRAGQILGELISREMLGSAAMDEAREEIRREVSEYRKGPENLTNRTAAPVTN